MDKIKDRQLAELLVLGQQGDKNAYERFLLEAAHLLRTYLSKRMGGTEVVEDVLQDTLLSVHRARQTYISEKPVGPWLYAICEHRMTDFFRKYRRIEQVEVSSPESLETFAGVIQSEQSSDRGDQVLEALRKLPERQRQVIELLKIYDLSVKEVAIRTGLTESAVKVTAFRGYETIRRFFGVRGK